tara:strand:+ start:17640 stop:18398 length:759 start_codon:yes stop_codon:yes gene_type:complete
VIDFETLERRLENLWNQFQNKLLSKGDIVSLYLLTYNDLFPVEHWLSWSPTRQHSSQKLHTLLYPKQNSEWVTSSLMKKIPPELSLGQVMNQSVFKKETLRSNKGLVHIFTQPDTVKILDYIPTPLELLEMQAHGYRCVTLLRTQNWFKYSFDHKRNLRDFVIHDLEHIWQMFENPKLTQQQIQFSKKLYELTTAGGFDTLRNDPVFSGEFNYIISDMNTHPEHMYATLKSLIQRQKTQPQDILNHFEHLRK